MDIKLLQATEVGVKQPKASTIMLVAATTDRWSLTGRRKAIKKESIVAFNFFDFPLTTAHTALMVL